MQPRRHDVTFYRDRTLVPGYLVGGKTGTAQIWDADPQRRSWRLEGGTSSTTRSSATSAAASLELVIAVRIEEAHPSIARKGQIELPVMSFELFRRIATNAMTLLDLPDPPPPVYVEGKDDGLTGDAIAGPVGVDPVTGVVRTPDETTPDDRTWRTVLFARGGRPDHRWHAPRPGRPTDPGGRGRLAARPAGRAVRRPAR